MRIKTLDDAEEFAELIGEENMEALGRALQDHAQVWIFQTAAEISGDPELTEEEKRGCLNILRAEGLGYAGWVRPPRRPPIPGLEPVPGYDTHGNSRHGATPKQSIH